jgi:hypothetical protein
VRLMDGCPATDNSIAGVANQGADVANGFIEAAQY